MAILIGKQPTGGTIYRGGSKTLSCSATSDRGSSLGYTWFRAGSRFGSGSSISANNSYVGTFAYFCRIVEYDTGATRDTNTVYVTVNATPVPVLDNANGVYDINCYKGDSISFSAASTVEKGTLTYLWERSLTAASWETVGTASTYSPPTTNLVTYLYRCTVTNTLNGYTATKMTNVGQVSISDTPTPNFTTGTDISDATYYLGTTANQLLGIVGVSKGTVTYQWQQSTNNSTWTNISGATARFYTPPTSSIGTKYYRLVATNTLNGYTKSATSTVAAITVAGAPVPVLNNANGVFDANYYRGESAATFDATATSAAGTISYQWQRSLTAASWENVATTATYTPPTSTVVTYLYRCIVTNTLGGSTAQKYTNVGQVSISDTPVPAFYAGTDIEDATYYRGASASELIGIVGVAKGNVTYQWQSGSNGTTFANISGATTRSYTPGTTVVGTLYYRLVVTNTLYGYTKTLTSDAAKIVVNDTPTPSFDANANLSNASYYRGVGAAALGGAVILNAGTLSIQWQSSANNSTFSNISGATSRTYTPPTGTVGTMYYRCVLTNTLNGYTKTTNSSSVRIVVNATPSPVLQNSNGVYDVNYYKGATASAFNATATSVSGTLTYKWERSLTTSTWEQVGTSATYTPPTNSVSTYYYRCTVTNSLGGYTAVVYTNVGQVTVLDTPTPTFVNGTDIANATYFRGAEATPLKAVISIGAGTLNYQWQQSSDGNTFSNISGATNTSYTPPTKVLGDMYYRVVVTNTLNGYTKTVNSSVAKITVNDTPSPTFGPNANMAGTGYYRGAPASAIGGEVINASGTVTAQWQRNTGSSWQNISGATGTSYTPPTSVVGTVQYRCILTNTLNGYSKQTTSQTVRIVVNDTPTAVIQNPGSIANATYYRGATAAQMNATASATWGTITYKWLRSPLSSGANWTEVGTSAVYTPPTNTVSEYLYRCEVTNTLYGYTKLTRSNTPTITVLATPVPRLSDSGVNLQDAIYEQGETPTALSALGTVAAGTISYQWQKSSDGNSYTDISGAVGSSLSPSTATVGTNYYRCILTNTLNGYTTTYTTDAAVITVQLSTYVTITKNPVSAAYYRGYNGALPLTCDATSSAGLTLTYVWYSNSGTQVGTGKSFNPSTANAGSTGYYCVVTDTNGASSRSGTATITIRATPVPVLTDEANLSSATYMQGDTATPLNASATASPGTITYQWQRYNNAWMNISGATRSTYTPYTTSTGATPYRCVITNTLYGYTSTLTTQTVAITVNAYAVPSFVQQPQGATYTLLEEAQTMSVVLSPDLDTYTYQWQESADGQEYSDIAGATRDYYTPSTASAGVKYYRVVVTNGSGSYAKTANSNAALVTVNMPPLKITLQPVDADYLLNAMPVPLKVAATAPGAEISYQWQQSAGGQIPYTDIENAQNQEYAPLTNAYGTIYYRAKVTASNNGQTVNAYSNAARIQVSDKEPPVFVKPLLSAAYEGNAVAVPLDGTATASTADIRYQWYWSLDNENFYLVSGATGAKFTPPTSVEGTRYYYVTATAVYHGGTAFARSNVAVITVTNVIYSAPVAWQKYLETLKTDFVKLAKLEFLQPDGSVAFALDNNPYSKRSGAFLQEGTLTVNLQNGKRRTVTVTLSNLDGEYEYNVNKVWFGQQIRLSEGLVLPNGQEFYLPQGVFYVVNPEESVRPGRNTVTWTMDDKWAYLDGTLFGNLEGIYEVPVNTNVFTGVQSVLALPRGNGYPVDNVTPLFTDYDNDQTTTLADGSTVSYVLSPYTARFEGDEQTYADVVLEMNTMIAGWVGYDQTGRLRMDPSQDDILDVNKPIQWAFTPTGKQFLGATYTVKNSEVFNDIIITGEGLDEYENVSGRATNFDPASDTNVNLIGRKVKRLSSPGYASDKQCENLAVFKLKRQTVLQKSVSIESAQIFHLQENQLVTIQRPDKPGNPVERHLVTGFTRPIAQKGSMQIEATSVNDFPVATVNALPWEE